jgi:23S rRNA (guanosine2251-2'-O)-methyltransferase
MANVIYGVHPVREALESHAVIIEKILVGTQYPHASVQALVALAKERNLPVTYAPQEALDSLARGGRHQNVVAVIREVPYTDLEEILSLRGNQKALILILDGIQDPQNLGSVIRTALGCGVQGIIIPKDRAADVTPAAMKASAGAAAHLAIARVVNIANTIDRLKKEGMWVYGAAGEAKDPVYKIDLTVDLAVVIGSEGKGIRPLVKKKCDGLFSIPMTGPVSSFNASVSAGMILYEVMRQRHAAAGEHCDFDT